MQAANSSEPGPSSATLAEPEEIEGGNGSGATLNAAAHPSRYHWWHRRGVQMRTGVALFIVLFSVLLGGLSGQGRCMCSCAIAAASATIGWAYFSCWSLSFWPQTLLNWSRKSVEGLSFDFVALNLAGFSCYAAFNCALYWSPELQAEYRASHHQEHSAVKTNDVRTRYARSALYVLHALYALCALYAPSPPSLTSLPHLSSAAPSSRPAASVPTAN